jgi:predicted amidohydrolase
LKGNDSLSGSPFLAVAIQYRASIQDYATPEAFAHAMRERMESVSRHFQTNLPALVVFPEDIGLGLVFTNDFSSILDCTKIAQAGVILAARYMLAVGRWKMRGAISLNAALVKTLSDNHIERIYRETFSRLAKEFGVYLCAGSAPIAPDLARATVYNLSYLFAPDGSLILSQPKTHLLEQEAKNGLGLTAARESELQVVSLPFCKLGIAVCYDAFFPSVIERLRNLGADVLVQPSFNPCVWSREQELDWKNGLWKAVQSAPGFRAGINPMMVGGLFDIQGEGVSSIVAPASLTQDRSGYLIRACSPHQEEIIYAVIPQSPPLSPEPPEASGAEQEPQEW